jgi:molybdopterin synthase sulfur carrier subunit
MDVNLFATLRQIAGQKTVAMSLADGATVRELLDAVVTLFPGMRDELLTETDELRPHVHVFINGQDAPYLELGLKTPISVDDKIDFFPAVGGG